MEMIEGNKAKDVLQKNGYTCPLFSVIRQYDKSERLSL
jgi:hypothetical protein